MDSTSRGDQIIDMATIMEDILNTTEKTTIMKEAEKAKPIMEEISIMNEKQITTNMKKEIHMIMKKNTGILINMWAEAITEIDTSTLIGVEREVEIPKRCSIAYLLRV